MSSHPPSSASAPDSAMNWVKEFFKRYPQLYRALKYIFAGQAMNMTALDFVESIPRGSSILNIGSGPRFLREDVTNVDIFPFEGVQVVASADALPFTDASADAVICDNVLEHVTDPQRVVAELYRVLKPGGRIYVAVPFTIPYHSSPHDYYRWTASGLRQALSSFTEKELKIQYGPSAAFTMVFAEWLALLLSFNSKTLYSIVLFTATILTVPLKFLDYLLVHYNRAEHTALSFYYIGIKK